METTTFSRGIVAGLFILSGSFVVKHFWPGADLINGFMKGMGITLLIMLLINKYKSNAS